MKAYFINVDESSITSIDYDGKLSSAQKLVDGKIDVFNWPALNCDVIVNDEFLYCFGENKGGWIGRDFNSPIIGNAILTGLPDENGDSTAITTPIGEVVKLVRIKKTVEQI